MTKPNIIVVGCDKGAWQIRGRQLGAALGADVTSKPRPEVWRWAEVIVLVKHAAHRWAEEATSSGARLVWDVLDIWAQPTENSRRVEHVIREIKDTQRAVGIGTLIAATQAMADDIGGIYLPHHSRDGLTPAAIRRQARIVAYEGNARFLGSWQPAIEQACAQLGLTFAVNPEQLSDADIIVAFRGERWDGELCRRWKSGVKYVNAIATGRPVLTQGGAAFDELKPPGRVVERQEDLVEAMRALLPEDVRQEALLQCRQLAPHFTIDPIATRYQQILRAALKRRAA